MIDHVCRERVVRDEISKHETSAVEARARQPSLNMSKSIEGACYYLHL